MCYNKNYGGFMKNNKKFQEVYINLDDSGKLTKKELICVYGGIVFFSKKEKDKFITQYRSIINNIKCSYCKYLKSECNKNCPEIKNINIKIDDKRRILNYLKKYFIASLVIKNDRVYDYIMESKGSKGRYIDYTIRRLIKEVIVCAIKNKSINPYKPVHLIINIDQQATKDNGYYQLADAIYEELVHGIQNFDYKKTFKPILFSELKITLKYQNSKYSYVIQAADLLAGTIRKLHLDKAENYSFVDVKIIFP